MELLSKPGVGGIIEKNIDGVDYILIQDRCKSDAVKEAGLFEIPAGKIRAFENIFDCLRREVYEETGLEIIAIEGEADAVIYEENEYKVINYTPFASCQNMIGSYPIMVQTFICKAAGKLLTETNETNNIRWISLKQLKEQLESNHECFYPMHVVTLKKYIKYKQGELP